MWGPGVVVVALALLPACTSGGDGIDVSRDAPLPVTRLGGRCEPGQLSELPAFAFGLESRGTWLRAASDGGYVPLGGDPDVPVPAGAPGMDGLLAEAVPAALKAGAEVSLRVGPTGRVNLAFAIRGDEHAFLGQCAHDHAKPAVEELLGRLATMYLARFPGQDSAQMKRTLGYRESVDVAHPGNAVRTFKVGPPREAVDPLPFVVLRTADLPPSWRNGHEFCPRMRLGIRECFFAGYSGTAGAMFYDPMEPVVDLYVRRVRGRTFGQHLVRLDLARLAADAGVTLGSEEPVHVRLRVHDTPTLREIVRSPDGQEWPQVVASVRMEKGYEP